MNLTVHEILHVLGVHKYLFDFFPDTRDGESVRFVDSKGVEAFRGETMVSKAREYFECEDIESLPMEDEGMEATQGNHLEARVFGNEIMTGSSKEGSRLSIFSLAILQDSGW